MLKAMSELTKVMSPGGASGAGGDGHLLSSAQDARAHVRHCPGTPGQQWLGTAQARCVRSVPHSSPRPFYDITERGWRLLVAQPRCARSGQAGRALHLRFGQAQTPIL